MGNETTIWLYWVDRGEDASPPAYLEVCLDSIRRISQCPVVICGPESARQYLPMLPPCFERLIPAHQADVFRTGMLAHYGGMYIDFDTFVLKPLRALFGLLDEYDFIGRDWYPLNPDLSREPLSISVLGPARPHLRFLELAFERQLEMVNARADRLLAGGKYPFKWEALLRDVVVPLFVANRPNALIGHGSSTWGALAGGPIWVGGDLGHMLMSMSEIGGQIPDTELLTICQSCFPEDVRGMSLPELLQQDTVLAHLIRRVRAYRNPDDALDACQLADRSTAI